MTAPGNIPARRLPRWIVRPLVWLWASPGTLLGMLIGGAGLCCGGRCRAVRGVLEFEGPLIRGFLRWIGRGASAMTLGHSILGRSPEDLERVRDHEHVHVRQYERWGPLFLPAYGLGSCWVWLRGRRAYWDNPFEVEAYAADAKRQALQSGVVSDRCNPPRESGHPDNPADR